MENIVTFQIQPNWSVDWDTQFVGGGDPFAIASVGVFELEKPLMAGNVNVQYIRPIIGRFVQFEQGEDRPNPQAQD